MKPRLQQALNSSMYRVCQLLKEVAPTQRSMVSGRGVMEFFPREAVDMLHTLFNIQVQPLPPSSCSSHKWLRQSALLCMPCHVAVH